MNNNNISINMNLDGKIYTDKDILDCKCLKNGLSICMEYDTETKLSFELKYFNDIILIGKIRLYQENEIVSGNRVLFGKFGLCNNDEDDDEKNFIDIEPNKINKEYSSISPNSWHIILLELKKRISTVVNDNQEIIREIFDLIHLQTYLEEFNNESKYNGIDFREILDRMNF